MLNFKGVLSKKFIWDFLYDLTGFLSWILRHIWVGNFWVRQSRSVSVIKNDNTGLSILFYSPVPSHPICHGSYARINALREQLQCCGHKVHFALLESVAILPSLKSKLFRRRNDEKWSLMRSAWDSVDLVSVRHLFFPFVSQVPLDGWYESSIGDSVRVLCERYKIDMVICSYVFQSKMLEALPDSIFKVIDTHDRMGNRVTMLKNHQIMNTWFSCSVEDEKIYLDRADVVLAIREEEAQYFNQLTVKKHAITISHLPKPDFVNYSGRSFKKIGWVSSDIPINFSMLVLFVEKLAELEFKHGTITLELHIAGRIKHAVERSLSPRIKNLFKQPWIIFHGFVPTIKAFYEDLDLVVAPVHCGTGINIKVVEALSFGMPLYATQCASKGIQTKESKHLFPDIKVLVETLYFEPPSQKELLRLASLSKQLYTDFYQKNISNLSKLLSYTESYEHREKGHVAI